MEKIAVPKFVSVMTIAAIIVGICLVCDLFIGLGILAAQWVLSL